MSDHNHDHGRAAYAVLREVRPLHLQAARAVTSALQGEPLTMAIRALLERLDDEGPQTVPQIARWLDVSRQAVQRVVDDARALGYIEVQGNPLHRRSHLVALTTQGADAFRRLHTGELVALAGAAADIDPADLLTCAAVLERLTQALASRAQAETSRRSASSRGPVGVGSTPSGRAITTRGRAGAPGGAPGGSGVVEV